MQGATDIQHLKRATQEGRVIVTRDADFLRLHAAGESHRGIVYAPQQMPVRDILRSLKLIHDLLTAEEMVQHIEFL